MRPLMFAREAERARARERDRERERERETETEKRERETERMRERARGEKERERERERERQRQRQRERERERRTCVCVGRENRTTKAVVKAKEEARSGPPSGCTIQSNWARNDPDVQQVTRSKGSLPAVEPCNTICMSASERGNNLYF